MTSKIVRFSVSLQIAEGKQEAFARIAAAMGAATHREPGTLGYDWYLSDHSCRLLAVYADAEAVVAHLRGPVVQELVPVLLTLATIDSFEIYGNPGPQAAPILADLGAVMYAPIDPPWTGLPREYRNEAGALVCIER